VICVLKTLCINCGYENTDWKRSDESEELISCYKCHSLYESDTCLIEVSSVESLRTATLK
jgi:hypothetical protein